MTNVQNIDLSHNRLAGTVPGDYLEPLWNHTAYNEDGEWVDRGAAGSVVQSDLRTLLLDGNRLEGGLPAELGVCCRGLTRLGLSGNRFNDTIPSAWLGALTSLRELSLQHNMLAGTLPSRLAEVWNPDRLTVDVSHNYFTGPLPSFTSAIAESVVHGNQWWCPLPAQGAERGALGLGVRSGSARMLRCDAASRWDDSALDPSVDPGNAYDSPPTK
eukprot:TRINITY_DN4184_c0_g1_i2.p1 TRINITY_DN4184_c0_g1~~TRINITY_DN4184_c0_g1_i2.p1  ORF type:complete len:215 (+),score=34.24 TRINITY_DN4184_c0_g1_i2:763-1407(+)